MKNKLLKRCFYIIAGVVVLGLVMITKMNEPKPDVLLFLPMTGPQSAYGTHLSRGMTLWLEDNPDWKNRIKVVDTQSSPQQSVSAFLQEIAYSKPKVAIVASTSVTNALRPLAEREGIFVLSVLTTAKSAISKGLVQRFSLSEQDSFLPSAEAFAKEKKLAFIYSADEYGLSQYKTLTDFLKQQGRKLDIEEMYDLKERNVRETIYKVVSQKPSAIYVSGFGPAYRNIFKEIESELGIKNTNGNLLKWAKQGVLLLNTVLTVEKGRANSHKNMGWENITSKIIQLVNEQNSPIVFMLWGSQAQAFSQFLNNPNHLILKCAHPSPLSAYNGFFGCNHFIKANEFLKTHNVEQIDFSTD